MSNQNFFPIERNKYYYGKALSVRDFEAEQDYNRNKIRLGRRLLDGAGVACGLGVAVTEGTSLLIGSGMALDYAGNEIVVEEPLLRKLRMLPGYHSLKDKKDAWLCLKYAEEDVDPVRSAKGEDGQENRFNKVRETYKLYLSADAPDYVELLTSMGKENVSVLYASDDVSVVLAVPETVRSGEEFVAEMYIVKNQTIPTVSVALEGISMVTVCDNDWQKLEYRQSPDNKSNVIVTRFKMKARPISDVRSKLFPQGAEIRLEYGHRQYKNFIEVGASVLLCGNNEDYAYNVRKNETLERSLGGAGLPIYLAKLELSQDDTEVYVDSITELPFGQFIDSADAQEAVMGRSFRVTTNVRKLEYWQEPEVRANYFDDTDTMAFDFAIPTPELYDYKITHGVVDIELPGGLRVNSRKVSDEITHGLGPGNVDVRLSVEFDGPMGETLMFSGNSEVFRMKGMDLNVPLVEAAAIVYPERGTMRIGIWLHDTVPGNRVRVHYFAQKPEYDTDRLLAGKKADIRIFPEVSRVQRGEKLNMKAVITGCDDTTVLWSIKDTEGGVIDNNGLYEAPATAGTYEIVAALGADDRISASAFIIVE